MSEYSISFARSARKELESLSNSLVQRILVKIEALGLNPRPPGCKKLKGSHDLWRIRIGTFQVIYSIIDQEIHIEIIAIRHRSDAYD